MALPRSGSIDGHYHGIWPDDFLFPLLVCPELADAPKLQAISDFLTDSAVSLDCVPDRIEADGLPIMLPGWYDGPMGAGIPAHLPSAWVRLLSYFESRGVLLSRKGAWAGLVKRSFDNVPLACGLVYIDPQRPSVGFGYHDNVAATGFELMTASPCTAAWSAQPSLFKGDLDAVTLLGWNTKAGGSGQPLQAL